MLFTKITSGRNYYCTRSELSVIDIESCAKHLKEVFNIDAFNNEVATAIRDCYININSFTM